MNVDEHTSALVVAVADGAGSSRHADRGAEIACKAFIDAAAHAIERGDTASPLTEADVRACIASALDAVKSLAAEGGEPVREFASTLLAAIVWPHAAAFIQIGDGLIVANGADQGGWAWVFWPARGEYANETTFLTCDEASDGSLKIEISNCEIAEIAILTDGIERLVMNHSNKSLHERFFAHNIAPIRSSNDVGEIPALSIALADYLSSRSITERTDDDVTLILASRLSPPRDVTPHLKAVT